MFRSISILALATLLSGLGFEQASAQTDPIPEAMRARELPRQRLSGPRFGFTTFTGDVARYRSAMGKESIMSQFGWQFEGVVNSSRKSSIRGFLAGRRGASHSPKSLQNQRRLYPRKCHY